MFTLFGSCCGAPPGRKRSDNSPGMEKVEAGLRGGVGESTAAMAAASLQPPSPCSSVVSSLSDSLSELLPLPLSLVSDNTRPRESTAGWERWEGAALAELLGCTGLLRCFDLTLTADSFLHHTARTANSK